MKTSAAILLFLQTSPEDGSALRRILGNLPTDPASVFTLLLMVGAVGAVLWFGRSNGDKDEPTK